MYARPFRRVRLDVPDGVGHHAASSNTQPNVRFNLSYRLSVVIRIRWITVRLKLA